MDVFDLFAKISIDTSEFEKGLNAASSKFQSFSKNLTSAGSGLKDLLSPAVDGFKAVESVGMTAGNAVMTGLKGFAAASTAVAGFGTAAVNSGANFDQAMSQVAATLGLTVSDIEKNVDGAGDTFDMLRQKALQMGSETNFTSREAAEGLNILAMSGYDATSSVGMIEDVLHLAAAGSMDMANAAGYVSGAMKGFNDETKESGYYADLMAKGATLANTSVAQLGEALSGGAATAKNYGQSAETTTLALLRLAEQGEIGSAASTALAAAMKNLYAPTDQAKKVMQSLGVNAFDPTTGSARDFNVVVNELQSALSGYTDEQRTAYAQTIFGIQGFDAYNKMVVTSTEKQDEWAVALANATGEAARQYDTMTDNLMGDLDKLSSAFEGLQITISDSLTPLVREFAQFGANSMNALREGFQGDGVTGFMSALTGIVTDGVKMLAEKAPEFASVSLQFIQALADGILGAGNEILAAADKVAFTLIKGVGAWISENSDSLITLGHNLVINIFSAFVSAGDIISENIGKFIPLIADAFTAYHEALFTVGLDILGAIGQGLSENKDEIQGWISITIRNMVSSLKENAPIIIEGGLALLEALVGAIEENMPLILETGATIIGELVSGIATASPGVQAIIATAVLPHILKIIDVVGSVGGAFKDVVDLVTGGNGIGKILDVGKTLMGGISKLWALLMSNPITQVITVVGLLVAAFVALWNNCEAFRNFWIGLWEGIKSVASAAVDGIKAAFDGIVGFFSDIVDGIKGVFDGIGEFLGGLFEAAWKTVQGAWDAAVEFFSGIGDGIREAFESVTSFLGDAFSAAWDAVSGVWEAATGFFGDIWDSIKGAAGEAADKIGGALSSAWDAVTAAWDGAMDFFQGIWEDITGVFANVWDKFKEIGGNIVQGIWDGISGAWGQFWDWLSGKVGGIIDGVKAMLGIHSPSTVFAGIGENMALGLAEGWDDEYSDIKRQITNGLNFGTASVGLVTNGTYNNSERAQNGPQTGFGGAGNTYVTINSPVAVDAVTAAREWKKTTQRMALGYV